MPHRRLSMGVAAVAVVVAVVVVAHGRKIGGAATFRQACLGLVGLGGFHVGRRGNRQSHLLGPADLLVNAGHGVLEWILCLLLLLLLPC